MLNTASVVGETLVTKTFRIDRESLVKYAGASGDYNPIHYRDDVAKAVGLPGVLAHGMLTMGIASQTVISLVDDPKKLLEFQVRFSKPIVVPAEGSVELVVSAKLGQISAETARIDLSVVAAETSVLSKAQAVVSLL